MSSHTLTEKNQDTAVTLARIEYAPDYTLGFGFDHSRIASFAPVPNHTETWNLQINFDLAIFVEQHGYQRAREGLDASLEDLE